ncbi:hypothetical protein BOTCAL_0026g00030 [Botryotinia calthae]|uniref:Uncharacterized protein n=1 Tax=Botryotinia calthae TaxID=38488 RepID=A0A4Y8DG85_9HELO|nr:hypothetical protein BOTCAL_0026g00030 [Botryotinia calthae]
MPSKVTSGELGAGETHDAEIRREDFPCSQRTGDVSQIEAPRVRNTTAKVKLLGSVVGSFCIIAFAMHESHFGFM